MIINHNRIDWNDTPEAQVVHTLEAAVDTGELKDYRYALPIFSEWFVIENGWIKHIHGMVRDKTK